MYFPLYICILSAVLFSGRAARLSSDILDFRTINYDTTHVHDQHRRAIRSPDIHRVQLGFQAFGKDFQLRLRPDNSVLSNKFVLASPDGVKSRHISDPVHFYEGDLDGVPGSHVHGSLRDGAFQGRILHEGEGYSVEPAERYFDNATEFHSVVYKDSHVVFPESHSGGSCGLKREMAERMQRRLDEAERQDGSKVRETPKEVHHESEDWTYRYKRQANIRQTCDLHIITDHVFYERYGDKYEILRQIGEHVQVVNKIYRSTDFGAFQDMNFAISKITVYEVGENNPFARGNIGVERFLDIASDVAQKDQEDFCLVFGFTNRDFANGVLGLAWIAERRRKSGGICGSSYNAGIVTTNNYGQNVAPLVSGLTFAHELGHSLGSRHDDDGSNCAPGGRGGNFIMYAHASSGDRERNDQFSTCSIGSISLVLEALGSSRDGCLKTANEVALCGNQIREADEECDCGVNNECGDMCCTSECTLRDGSKCSPQQGPCCSDRCDWEPAGVMCANITECAKEANCTGNAVVCPTPFPRNENEECDGGRKTCDNGTCSRSICKNLEDRREECQCSVRRDRCFLCCQIPDNPTSCAPYNRSEQLMLNVGSPCENFIGYCDILLRCQIATEDGPLATIFRALVPDFDGGPEEVQLSDAVLNFFRDYWWVVVLAVIFLIGVMALIMFLCNLLTPTDNPWKEEVHNARRDRVNLRARRDRGSQYPTSVPKNDGITAF